MHIYQCQVASRRTAAAWLIDFVASHSKMSTFLFGFVGLVFAYKFSISNFFSSLDWNILVSDEENCIGAFDSCSNALC